MIPNFLYSNSYHFLTLLLSSLFLLSFLFLFIIIVIFIFLLPTAIMFGCPCNKQKHNIIIQKIRNHHFQ